MSERYEKTAFTLLLAGITVAFAWVVRPFYGAVLWAVILAILFRPLQVRLVAAFGGRRTLAAIVTLLVCIVAAILPVTLVLLSVVAEGAALVERIQSGEVVAPRTLAEALDHLPGWIRAPLDRLEMTDFEALRGRLAEAVGAISQFLAAQAVSIGENTLRFAASLGIMLYVLFFLFRDGSTIFGVVRQCLPFERTVSDALLDRFASVVRATVKGNIIIAAVQGGIGGLAFWLLGIPGALLWGVLMAFLSLLPAVGAALVWAPFAAYLLLSGDVGRGAALLVIGAGVISVIDNLLRPPLVGKEAKLPDYLVLVSTLGGLATFGINGFVLGPLVAALFVASWTLFREARDRDRVDRAG